MYDRKKVFSVTVFNSIIDTHHETLTTLWENACFVSLKQSGFRMERYSFWKENNSKRPKMS